MKNIFKFDKNHLVLVISTMLIGGILNCTESQKTILITGGAGYIGSAISHLFHTQGYNIIIIDDLIYDQKLNQPWAHIIKSDFSDKKTIAEIFTNHKIDCVIHCAAFIEVGKSIIDPAAFYKNNVAKTITLLDAMRLHSVKKIIFSSSCAVYGLPKYLPMDEKHPKDPLSPYGKTKLMVEEIIQDYAKAYGMKFVIFRYFNACGAVNEKNLGERHKPETHLIPLALEAAHSRKV